MLAYGLRRGAVPAVRWLLILAFGFLLAYTLRDWLAPYVQKLLRKMERPWVEALSFIVVEIVVIAGLSVPVLMHSQETVPMRKQLDRLFGMLFGIAGGVVLSGLLILTLMVMPAGRRMFHGSTDWYLAPQRILLQSFGFLTRTNLSGGRPFVEEIVIRDLERGRPKMPLGEHGIWVSSVPVGLRVYLLQAEASKSAAAWKKDLEVLLPKDQAPARPAEGSRSRRIEGFVGRTPILVPLEVELVKVAVEMPVPRGLSAEGASPFFWDGEDAWFSQKVFGEDVVVKIYQLPTFRDTGLATLISCFVPKDMDEESRFEWYDRKLPGRDCFSDVLDEKAASEKLFSVTTTRAAEEHYLPWLRRGGKAVLEANDTNELVVLEVTADKTLRDARKPAGFAQPALQ